MDATYFGELAMVAATQSTCIRRKFGAVIVDPITKQIISVGFNGSPSGKEHCADINWCLRNELEIPAGERYEVCRSLHGEMNAILRAGQRDTVGAHMYIAGFEVTTGLPVTKPLPCFLCTKMIINAHISKVFLYNKRNVIEVDIDLLYDQYVQDLFNRGKQE